MTVISLNVLGLPAPAITPLLDWVAAARPDYTLVMDNSDLAARTAMMGTTIIFRRYRPDDAKLPETTSPQAFLDSVSDLPSDWIVQAGNEPNGNQPELVRWTVDLMRLAGKRRFAVGNWSVGNPDDEAVRNGLYDPILRALAGSRHVLSVHEYFHDKPLEEPYFVGRYRAFLQRADRLGIARPVVVITEHGRDLGGGSGDGWRGQGWTEEQYAERLEQAQQVYRADGVTACVFCYGGGFDERWQSFNVEGANRLLTRMAGMNAKGEDMVPGYFKAATLSGKPVNVRSTPYLDPLNTNVVGTLAPGDWMKQTGKPVRNGNHLWVPIAIDKDAKSHLHGYVAWDVLKLPLGGLS
jgi:hypothetical protein